MNNKKIRDSNFELMRIVSMLFIVLGHIFYWGGIDSKSSSEVLSCINIIYAIILVHVNSFIMVSGYYQSHSKSFKIKKVLKLLFYVWFYNLIIMIIGQNLGWFSLTESEIIYTILPLKHSSHWFIYTFVFLYCISPYLNVLINNIEKKNYEVLLIILFIFCSIMPAFFGSIYSYFNSGYSIINFVFIYLIGAYIRKYFNNLSTKKIFYLIGIFLLCVILNFGLLKINKISNQMFMAYNNPIIIISSISYFLIFKLIKIKSKLINILSKHVLEVYIISEIPRFRSIMYNFLGFTSDFYDSKGIILYSIFIAFVIFAGCIAIAYTRELIFTLLKKVIFKTKIYKEVIKIDYKKIFSAIFLAIKDNLYLIVLDISFIFLSLILRLNCYWLWKIKFITHSALYFSIFWLLIFNIIFLISHNKIKKFLIVAIMAIIYILFLLKIIFARLFSNILSIRNIFDLVEGLKDFNAIIKTIIFWDIVVLLLFITLIIIALKFLDKKKQPFFANDYILILLFFCLAVFFFCKAQISVGDSINYDDSEIIINDRIQYNLFNDAIKSYEICGFYHYTIRDIVINGIKKNFKSNDDLLEKNIIWKKVDMNII